MARVRTEWKAQINHYLWVSARLHQGVRAIRAVEMRGARVVVHRRLPSQVVSVRSQHQRLSKSPPINRLIRAAICHIQSRIGLLNRISTTWRTFSIVMIVLMKFVSKSKILLPLPTRQSRARSAVWKSREPKRIIINVTTPTWIARKLSKNRTLSSVLNLIMLACSLVETLMRIEYKKNALSALAEYRSSPRWSCNSCSDSLHTQTNIVNQFCQFKRWLVH